MRSHVIQAIGHLDPVAVENHVCPGTPDINYAEGWIELKWLREWPKRADSNVPVPHFTPQQRVWLSKRQRAGGAVFLLLQCKREWMLFDGVTAAKLIDRASRPELIKSALLYMSSGLNAEELSRCLTCRSQTTSPQHNSSQGGATNGF